MVLVPTGQEPDRVVVAAKTPRAADEEIWALERAVDAELETGILKRLDTRVELDELS